MHVWSRQARRWHVSLSALGAKKPAAACFAALQPAVNIAAEKLLLLDDTLENAEAARVAKWQALHWTDAMVPESLRTLYR